MKQILRIGEGYALPAIKRYLRYVLLIYLGVAWLPHNIAQAQSQSRVITGTVISAIDGKPLEGATVKLKQNGVGVLTGKDGRFHLNTPIYKGVLVVTFVGYQAKEVDFNPDIKMPIIIKLVAEGNELEEVEVSTGYQHIPKERATGSFSSVDMAQFNGRVSTSVIDRLEGITNGLVFNKNSTSGERELTLRGRSTIFANDQPLIVVDNFPYEGNIGDLNPNDLSAISILKDAAAASIWGVRAGNGVIVITTKKGQADQPMKIQLNTNFTIQGRPDLYYNPNYMASPDYIDVEKMLFQEGYYAADLTSSAKPAISPVVDILSKLDQHLITQDQANQNISGLAQVDMRDALGKFLYQPSLNQQYALNISGGTNSIDYYFSGGYDHNRPNTLFDRSERYSLTSNTTFRPVHNLSLSAGVNFIQGNTDQNQSGTFNDLKSSGRDLLPYMRFRDAQGNALPIMKNYNSNFLAAAEDNGFLNWQYIPVEEQGRQMAYTNTQEFRINLGAGYQILNGLTAELRYQYQQYGMDTKNLASQKSFFVRDMVNSYATVDAGNGKVQKLNNVPIGDIASFDHAQNRSYNWRGQLNFNKEYAHHQINAIAGFEQREIIGTGNASSLYGYNDDIGTFQIVEEPTKQFLLYPLGRQGIIPAGLGTTGTTDRFRSYFGNASYTYADKYYLSASGRIDQSNFFGVTTNNRSVPLWSVGGKWDLYKESFLHFTWLDQLSMRATYGFNGNLDKTQTAITTFSYSGTGSILNNARYAEISNIGNPELRWEKTSMINLGVDFLVLEKRISGNVEYFHKKGVDLMGDAPFPPSSGVEEFDGNYAGLSGNGFDAEIHTRNLTGDFKWNSTLLFNYATDKITKYDIPINPSSYIGAATADNNLSKYPIVGYPLYAMFSYRFAGLDHDTGNPMGYYGGETTMDYNLLTRSPEIADLKYSGAARPVYSGGFTNSFSYKRITLSINITYKLGYYFRRSTINYQNLFSMGRGHSDFSRRWKVPGDENFTDVPAMIYPAVPNRDSFYGNTDLLVEKGDHVRLQYIGIDYDFSLLKKDTLPFRSLQLYAYANDLGIIWKANKSGLDPDFYARSNASFTQALPPRPSISLGIKADF